jgi:uncharacterized membrane protein
MFSFQPDIREWLNLLVRLTHFIAGIMWIGTSFYFVWLDSVLEKPPIAQKGLDGETYLVHGGLFFRVEKRRFGPGEMPKTLHWFIWEATATWVSGFILLWVVYYTTGGAYLTDPVVKLLTQGQATAIGLAVIFGGWMLYEGLFRLPLARSRWGSGLAVALLAGLIWFLTRTFSGRGAFIELGAMLGTIMVGNVWLHIIPNQRALVRAANEGKEPDYRLGAAAKRRSMHNSYVTIPVLFTMISNHFSSLYDNKWNAVILALVVVAGACARHVMISARTWPLVPGVAAVLAMVVLTGLPAPIEASAAGPKVTWGQANEVIHLRCMVCHSAKPSDDVFHSPPQGVAFDDPQIVKALVPRIWERVVVQQTMPFADKTGMTRAERELIAKWILQGAPVSEAK